jgi:HEAT repeat protein
MPDTSVGTLQQLVADLGHREPAVRKKARFQLTRSGASAVPPLLGLLRDPRRHVRWEAAKTLADIADPAAAETLVAALADRDADVRWVVGEALIALGAATVEPLLKRLTRSDLPGEIYPAAHHVLRELATRNHLRPKLWPVIKALDRSEPEIHVPIAANRALDER